MSGRRALSVPGPVEQRDQRADPGHGMADRLEQKLRIAEGQLHQLRQEGEGKGHGFRRRLSAGLRLGYGGSVVTCSYPLAPPRQTTAWRERKATRDVKPLTSQRQEVKSRP